MNRTQRRQQERQAEKSKVTYSYSPIQLRAEIDKRMQEFSEPIRKETTKEVVNMLFGIFAIAMHDEMGFGYKRIGRVLDKVKTQFRCIESRHVSLDDILKECKRLKVHIEKII